MQQKGSKGRHLLRCICLILTVVLLIPISIPILTSFAAIHQYKIHYESRVADPNTSTPAFMGFLDIPKLHDGRIWTDKSVMVDTDLRADDFMISLSALSQSFSLYDGFVVPTDTVFIIDVSGSMFMESINGRPRIAVLVEALNEAIGILLDANSQNRIAVTAYGGLSGGFSRAENVLPLGRPELLAGAAAFFTYRPGSPNNYVDVNTTNRITASILVQGSTPTQRGILLGSRILENANELTIPALTPTGDPYLDPIGNPQMVTRKPNFILMTDGEPTMAWSDYLFTTEPTNINQNYGDGSNGETGVSLLTVLTAAHRKRLVHQYYYELNPLHDSTVLNYRGSGDEPLGFYTISLNTEPTPLLISATMFPFIPGSTVTDGNADIATPAPNGETISGPYPSGPPLNAPMDSMGYQLRELTGTGNLDFFAQRRLVYPNYQWQQVNITNPASLTQEELAYADAFFPASDLQTLRDAFASIATELQKESYSGATSSDPGEEQFDGYLVFSDVIGEYMEFRGIIGFEFDNVTYNRAGFAQAIVDNTSGARTRYEDILYRHLNYGNMPGDSGYDSTRYTLKARVVEMIDSNIVSGYLAENNSIKYYAYGNRDFAGSFFNSSGTNASKPAGAVATVDVFPMWGSLGTPVHSGGATDLMYITFHVVTVLEDNTEFEEVFSTDAAGNPLSRTLKKDDQMVRWYIPSVLIPQRRVDRDTGVLSGNTLPIKVYYKVGLNEPLIEAGVSAEYIAQYGVEDDVYFYTNHYPKNVSLSFFQPHVLNPYYQTGRPGFSDKAILKASNPTETTPNVILNRFTYIPGEGRTDIQWLGNNGRITIDMPDRERSPQTGTFHRTSPYIVILIISVGLLSCAFLCIVCLDKEKLLCKGKRNKRDK